MKKLKSILALILTAAMCLALLAACGSGSTETAAEEETAAAEETTETAETEEAAEEPAEEAEETEEPAEEAVEEDDEEDIITIELYALDRLGDAATSDKVFEKFNEICESEIGVHVNFHLIEMGNYDRQVNLAITGGDTVDLACTWPPYSCNYSTMLSAGQLIDASSYLYEYAPELMEMLGDYATTMSVGDEIYGVPVYRNYCSQEYLLARADILEELGLTEAYDNMETWEDYIEICNTVKDNVENMYPIASMGSKSDARILDRLASGIIMSGTGSLYDAALVSDTLGDNLHVLAEKDGQVFNAYASDEYVAAAKKMAEWYNDGLIYADASATENTSEDQMTQNIAFSFMSTSEYGVEVAKESVTGYDLTAKQLYQGYVTTTTITGFGIVFTTNTREPEACAKFLNLLYQNADLNNLFVWGIEGEDYDIQEDGTALRREDCNWGNADWIFGNQFLVLPASGNDPDQRAICQEITDNATLSPYMGFTFDTTELTNEVSALTLVYNEYIPALSSGNYTDELYQEFTDKMEAAGIEDYVAGAQAQLDAWVG